MYAVPTYSDFQTMFPELSAKPQATFDFWMNQSKNVLDPVRWDDLYFMGALYWVAHSITNAAKNAATPGFDDAITKKVGDIMKTRSERVMLMQLADPLMATGYGQEYKKLQALVGIGGFVV